MNIDYIIVGCGLAGIAFCEQLKINNKSFIVFDDKSQKSSVVAGGLYNPVVLKRFSKVWKSQEQLKLALPIYNTIQNRLQTKIDYKIPVRRRFTSLEEQNNWFEASDKDGLKPFLSTTLIDNQNPSIDANFKLGEVLETGRIDTKVLIDSYINELTSNNQFINSSFKHEDLFFSEHSIQYQHIQAKYIVFAEGFGLKQNPFFKNLPLNGTKGELITIKAPQLDLDYVLKSSAFIIPQKEDIYVVGATYEWVDKTNKPTIKAKEELLNKLKTFIKCDFEVIDQVAGIRPTVKDRRPLVGSHPKYKNMFVLNGLGTRGVMIGPYIANQLYNFIEKGISLDTEINIDRFLN